MPEARLQRARESLPEGYQFPTHHHFYGAQPKDAQGRYHCECGHSATLWEIYYDGPPLRFAKFDMWLS